MKNFSINNVDRPFLVATGAALVFVVGTVISGVGAISENITNTNHSTSDSTQTQASPENLSSLSATPKAGIIDYPKSLDNPLQIQDKNLSDTTPGKVQISYKDGKIHFANGVDVSSKSIGETYTAAKDDCFLEGSGDICLAGTSRLGDLSYNYFALKDVSRNTILKDAYDVRPLSIKGAHYAISASINKSSGSSRVVMFSVPQTSVGMLVDLGDTTDQVESDFVNSISVAHSNKQ